jgi:formamidopyrimidine-DNA glycosylase
MPELPEVEVVKRSLENIIINSTIVDVKINEGNLRYKVKKSEINQIIGLKIVSIKRRSKYLLFFFNKDIVMLAHLGMTGKFFIEKNNQIKLKTSFYYNINENKDNKHNHLIFIFKNKLKLIYNDVRKFGFIKFDLIKNIKKNSHLKILGPEPLSNFFNYIYFKDFIIDKNRTIKGLLMDQKFISGLGNIYVNEILFFSKIKPNRKVSKLNNIEIKQVIKHTKNILKRAINLGGSSIKDFSNSSGKKGSFQQQFKVYGKKGNKCSNSDCNGVVRKIVLASRASFFCPKCQK